MAVVGAGRCARPQRQRSGRAHPAPAGRAPRAAGQRPGDRQRRDGPGTGGPGRTRRSGERRGEGAGPARTGADAVGATLAPTPSRANTYTCISIGPFATPVDLHNARNALTAQAARMRSRQEQTTQSRGWWVYLPASPSRDQALAQARRLSAANISDYFVVGAGGQPNTISLGLFKDPANARKRRDEVAAAGFPAQMAERSETVPEYWLDLAVADGAHFDWRSRLRNAAGVGSHSTGCF